MTTEDKESFKQILVKRMRNDADAELFLEVFSKIDSKNMEAFKQDDRDMIEKFIVNELGGFGKVDLIVASGLRTWVGKTAVNLCGSYTPNGTAKHGRFMVHACSLLNRIGMFNEMLTIARKTRKIYEDLNAEEGIFSSKNWEAVALMEMGSNDEAVVIFKELLDFDIKKHGELHHTTLRGRLNFGRTYMSIKMWDEAEEQFTTSLKGLKEIQPPMSLHIRIAQSSLAYVFLDSGREIERAKVLIKEVLDYEMKESGPDHVEVLGTEVHYARCLALQGEHKQALTIYGKAFPVLLKTFGEKNQGVKELQVWMHESEYHVTEIKE